MNVFLGRSETIFSHLTTGQLFTFPLKCIYFFIGQSFVSGKRFPLIYIISALKMTIAVVGALYYYIGVRTLVNTFIDTSIDTVAAIEFAYLFFHSNTLKHELDQFFRTMHIDHEKSGPFVKSMRKLNCCSCVIISFTFSMYLANGLANLLRDGVYSWLVTQVLIVDFYYNETTQAVEEEDEKIFKIWNWLSIDITDTSKMILTILVGVLFVYQAIINNYVSLSTSFYVSYFKILLYCKTITLREISSSTSSSSFYGKLNGLDDLMDAFESTISALPLAWLYYNIGPGLVFLYFNLQDQEGPMSFEQIFSLCYNGSNFLLVLVSLYMIARWQDQFNEQVDDAVLNLEQRAQSTLHFFYIRRMEETLKRPVTVFSICPIDRSLILAYISCAITFTTLFVQFMKQPKVDFNPYAIDD